MGYGLWGKGKDTKFMFRKGGIVYILTNTHHSTLYVGVTSTILGRLRDHKEKLYPKSFSAKYNLCKFVYYEIFDSIEEAIDREKQLKAGPRQKKIDLINQLNPAWEDLTFEFER
jgi:putative endonuclease